MITPSSGKLVSCLKCSGDICPIVNAALAIESIHQARAVAFQATVGGLPLVD